jgi:hypothetical protein
MWRINEDALHSHCSCFSWIMLVGLELNFNPQTQEKILVHARILEKGGTAVCPSLLFIIDYMLSCLLMMALIISTMREMRR